MERKFIIYKITNLINGKIYIGKTIQRLSKRMAQHRRTKTTPLARAIKKYTWEKFKVDVVEECNDFKELNEREKFWIAHYNCKVPEGYNLADGGEGPTGYAKPLETRKKISESRKGFKHTDETKRKMSEARKKYFENPEARENLARFARQRHHTDETKAKISAIGKGRHHTDEAKAKISAHNKGLKRSPESKANIIEAAKKRAQTEEGKAHLLAASKKAVEMAKQGLCKRSEETKRKISLSRKDKKRVRCIETGEIFESLSEAARKYNSRHSDISRACRGLRNVAGGKHWEFVDDDSKL